MITRMYPNRVLTSSSESCYGASGDDSLSLSGTWFNWTLPDGQTIHVEGNYVGAEMHQRFKTTHVLSTLKSRDVGVP
jgi:hypothetical protein